MRQYLKYGASPSCLIFGLFKFKSRPKNKPGI